MGQRGRFCERFTKAGGEKVIALAITRIQFTGDLPPGVYRATLDEIVARFGKATAQRQRVTAQLRRIFHLAQATGKLDRLVICSALRI